MIRELFDNCSHTATSYFEEIEADDLDTYMKTKRFILPNSEWHKQELTNGSIVYEVVTSGILNRYTFTEI